jgi:NAD(P)-dependent dehydrogenase (short-subunit alcohol dehydrogenase family)
LKSLEQESTKKEIYEILIMDVSSLASVRKAVEELKTTSIDGLILNAGGGGMPAATEKTADGVTTIFAANVLGHVLLIDLLLENKILTSGGSVVCSSKGSVRGVSELGVAPIVLKDGSVEEIAAMVDGSGFPPKTDVPTIVHPSVKMLATLWMGSMARKEPLIRFVTMCPGMTHGTSCNDESPLVQWILFKYVMFPILRLFGMAHNAETGSKRYINALVDGETYKTGRFYGAKEGVIGEVADQEIFSTEFYKEELPGPCLHCHSQLHQVAS